MYNGPARAPRKPIMIIEWAHRRDVTRRRRGGEGEKEEREEKRMPREGGRGPQESGTPGDRHKRGARRARARGEKKIEWREAE